MNINPEPSREELETVLAEINAYCISIGKLPLETIIDFIKRLHEKK